MFSFTAWIVTPMVLSPLPRWNLILQDLHEFSEVVVRGKKGTVRSLYECGLADELIVWGEHDLLMLLLCFSGKVAAGGFMLAVLPAEILDFVPIFLVLLSFSWVAVFGYFMLGQNNIFLIVSY